MGSIPGSGRSSRVGNGKPLQYSSLENSMDRGAWRATVHKVANSRTQLSVCACAGARTHTHTHTHRHTHTQCMYAEPNSFTCHSKMAAYQSDNQFNYVAYHLCWVTGQMQDPLSILLSTYNSVTPSF